MTEVVILWYQGKDLLKLQASGCATGWLSTNPSARTLNIGFSFLCVSLHPAVLQQGEEIWAITVGPAVASHLALRMVLLWAFWGLALEKGWIVALNYEVWEQLELDRQAAVQLLFLSEQSFCAVPSHCTNAHARLLLDWLVLIPFRKGFGSSNFGFITVVRVLPCCSEQASYRGCPKELPMGRGECGIKNQSLNPVELGHQCGLARVGSVTKQGKMWRCCVLLLQGMESFEGELSLGWMARGWAVTCWVPPGAQGHTPSPISYQLVDKGI